MTKKKSSKISAENTIRNIRRNSRRQYSGEEKIRIVLEGLRGEESIAELRLREGISQSVYYRWSKEFLEEANSVWHFTEQWIDVPAIGHNVAKNVHWRRENRGEPDRVQIMI